MRPVVWVVLVLGLAIAAILFLRSNHDVITSAAAAVVAKSHAADPGADATPAVTRAVAPAALAEPADARATAPAAPPAPAAPAAPPDADDAARRTQTRSDVLAAPDLARFELAGAGASGHLQWSRSRGLVFDASGLQAPPANSVYEIWLMTNDGPVSVGLVVPDASGQVTLTTDAVPNTSPATGVSVTLEPLGGSAAPSGEIVLLAR